MKTIILAGGWGTRLGQITDLVPKPMVQIGNKPILWHIMKIYAHYGYKDFIISAGVKAYVIKDYFLNYELYSKDFTRDFSTDQVLYDKKGCDVDWRVTVVDTGLNALKGARIKRVEKYLDDDVNMITYGDGLSDVNVSELVAFHRSHGKTITVTGVHPPARFGEITEIDNRVISFEEKPQTSIGLINGGFMVFNRNLLDCLTDDDRCDFEFGALEQLTRQGEVMVYKHKGFWECIDHERDLNHLNHLWENNRAFWRIP